MNGYVLTKWKFRVANTVFAILLFGMFIPYQSILIPLVQLLQKIKLYGSIPGLIFVHCVYSIPITTLIFRNYYSTIPTDIIEASKIDGAGFTKIYTRTILPVPMPAFAVVMIWQFTSISRFFVPLLGKILLWGPLISFVKSH